MSIKSGEVHSYRTRSTDGEWSDYYALQPDSAIYPSVPTFLVHGWNGHPESWGNNEAGPIRWLRDRHVSYAYGVTGLNRLGVPGELFFAGNAELLSSFVESRVDSVESGNVKFLGEQVPVPRIDIVAHSMGGQIARRYIVGTGHRQCRKLVMLASPNQGTVAGDVVCKLMGEDPDFPGTGSCEMGYRKMAAFNAWCQGLDSTEVWLAAGTGGLVPNESGGVSPGCPDWLKVTALAEDYPNDGLVALSSALGYPGMTAGTWKDFEHGQLLCHYLDFWTTHSGFDYWVLPILTDPYFQKSPELAGKQAREDEQQPQFLVTSCSPIEPGEQSSHTFVADGGMLYVGVMSTDSRVLLTLESPTGVIYDPNSSGSQYLRSDLGRGYLVLNGEAGDWVAHISGDSLETASAAYCLVASIQNGLAMSTALDRTQYGLHDVVQVTATIKDAEIPVTGASVNCTVVLDGAEPDTVHTGILLDDGLHGDGLGGDGVYGAGFSGWDSLGVYAFAIEADGTAPNAGPFHREAEEVAVMTVQEPAAVAGGSQSVRASSLVRIRPNPSMDSVQIDYAVSSGIPLRLEVFDVQGRRVRSVAEGSRPAGSYQTTWDGRSESGMRVAPGVYWVRLQHAGVAASRAVVILR